MERCNCGVEMEKGSIACNACMEEFWAWVASGFTEEVPNSLVMIKKQIYGFR